MYLVYFVLKVLLLEIQNCIYLFISFIYKGRNRFLIHQKVEERVILCGNKLITHNVPSLSKN